MSKKKEKSEIISQLQSLKNIPKFFKLIWKINPRYTFITIALRAIQAVLPVSILYVGKQIIDEVVRLVNLGIGTQDMQQLDEIIYWTFVGLGLAILMSVLARVIGLFEGLLGDLVNIETSVLLIRHASTLDLYQFENPVFYDKLSRAQAHNETRTTLMGLVLSQIQDTFTVIALIIALIAFSPWLVVILVVAVLPAYFGESYFNKQSYFLTTSWTPERRELDYLRIIGTSDVTAKEIKTFGLEKFITSRFDNLSHQYYEAAKKIATNRAIFGSIFSGLSTVAYYGAYIFVLFQTVEAIITIGTMTFLGGAFQRLQTILQATANRFSNISYFAFYLKDFFDFLELKPFKEEQTTNIPLPKKIISGFTFENVSFQYPETNFYAIKNLSFTLKAGEKLALVGENGAGKTTLVKLLARLYTPTEGRILLDGIDIQDYDLEEYRTEIGVIFQDYVRYMFSANDNIAVGNIRERFNNELIKEAAEKSLANKVIANLEHKYNQMLGKRFEGGVELSGGQWQKIALARAYMRNAQLVILDEPTAALDARAEHEVFVRFAELMVGKTGVIISHRFSTVRMADRILFLEHGNKLELGSHKELLEKGGKYSELFSLQAKGYA